MKKTLCAFLLAVMLIGLLAPAFTAYAYLDYEFADEGNVGDYEERPEYAYNDPKNGTNVTYSFDSLTGTLVIYHNPTVNPSGKMASYSTSLFAGKTAIRHLIVNEGVTDFCNNAFSGCTGLQDVSLPGTMAGIAAGAFAGCTALKSVTLRGSVKYIGSSAFTGCSSLTEVHLNEGLEDIGQYAFNECIALKEITFPETLTAIHASAFYGSGLEAIGFNNSACLIYSDAFLNCACLTEAELGDNVTLNPYAFSYCTALKSIDIPGVNETIYGNTFYYCTALETVKMNEGTKVIDEMAFEECTAVKAVEIPKSLVSVSGYAFRDCEAITDVYYKGTQAQWEQIEIGNRNDYLTNAKIHFNASMPEPGVCSGEHSWDAGVITEAADCTKTGTMTFTCTLCSETKTETIPKKAHTPKTVPAVPATCTKTGLTAGRKCSVCGAILTAQKTVAKLDHVYKDIIIPAAPAANGKITPTCSVCGMTKSATVIAKASGITISKTKFVYNGKVQKPTLAVKNSAGKTIDSKFYTAKWSNENSKAVGSYTVKVTLKGNYSGTKTLTYTIVPKAVTGLKNAKAAKTAITLNWYKATGAKYYEVYGSADGKTFKKIATTDKLTLKVTKIDGKALAAGKTYRFKIRALDATKKLVGAFSTVLKTGTLTETPKISKLTSTKAKQAAVIWGKVNGASKYIVYKSTDNKTFTKVKTTSELKLTLTKLTAGRKIYVKIIAVNAYGAKSAYSTVKTVTVKK